MRTLLMSPPRSLAKTASAVIRLEAERYQCAAPPRLPAAAFEIEPGLGRDRRECASGTQRRGQYLPAVSSTIGRFALLSNVSSLLLPVDLIEIRRTHPDR